MKLSFEEIKSITLGAEYITEENDGIHFHRYNKEQEEAYVARKADFLQYYSTSGIKLRFLTDSKNLVLKVFTSMGSAREYFSFDIYVNGKFYDYINNFYSIIKPVFPDNVTPLGDYDKEFTLPDGEKEVSIYFPWSACGVLKELSLDDGASLIPIKPKKSIMFFGDSITQGWDALLTSNKYTTRLADYLDAEEFNKGMGGDGFFPELIEIEEKVVPEYIVGAYGTNNWSCHTTEEFDKYCHNFYKNLSEKYPNSKIYAISPIWRRDYATDRKFGPFLTLEEHMRNAVAEFKNITFIPGFNLLEHKPELFRELTLHPNDDGFEQYCESLKKIIK